MAQSPISNQAALRWLHRRQAPDVAALQQGILARDRVALSRAITLIESTRPDQAAQAEQLIQFSLQHAQPSWRIGITGVPGVGKSTFIEALGNHLIDQGLQVAVLAIDPSSAQSHGSILGDKTRMEQLVRREEAFIRPSAAGSTLGGVARKTREALMLCEAYGFDVILVETVGVGQSEILVHQMVDFFLLLKITGAGDELQGIKRGIMEMADAICINKADGDNLRKAQLARSEFERALHFFPPNPNGWIPEVHTVSALEQKGVQTVWDMVSRFVQQQKANGWWDRRRAQQNQQWLHQTLQEQLFRSFVEHPEVKAQLVVQEPLVASGQLSPFEAARQLLAIYHSLNNQKQ